MNKVCLQCGKEYTPSSGGQRGKEQKYCSRDCMAAARTGESSRNWKGGHPKLICQNPNCGKEFTSKHYGKDALEKYCSIACRSGVLIKEKSSNWRGGKIELICQNPSCQKKFVLYPSIIAWSAGKYCSIECMGKGASLTRRRENSANWRGGITPESILIRNGAETQNWRESVFARDNYTCQKCNKRGGVVLHAHHIYNFSSHLELRFDVDNGITLCEDCHDEFHKLYGKSNNDQNEIDTFIYWNLGDNKIMEINKEVN